MSTPVGILGTGTVLPGRRRTTAEVLDDLGKGEQAARYEALTGIHTRYWCRPDQRVASLAAEALALALVDADLDATALRRIILVYSGVNDLMFPATANRVAAHLGLRGSCDAFDLCNACMGFLTAFDLAARSVATGLGPVGVVSAELTSRAIRPSDWRPYLVFGDAVAAAIVGRSRDGSDVLASFLGNDGSHPLDVFAEHSSLTGTKEYIQFSRSSGEIFEIAMRGLGAGLDGVLQRARLRLDKIEWVLPHQPNGAMVDKMLAQLRIDPARVVRVVDEIGSVASASIPVSLDRLRRTRPVKPGDRILMAGVGGGISYGGILYRVGAP
jgi:3-oxoacyl-(acyl-carrier-protein) synthase III